VAQKIDTQSRLTFDMTPMIDCTFQLVIFFMLTLNYSMEEHDERIKLPTSELAKPVEVQTETNIMLQITGDGRALVGGEEVPLAAVRALLDRERQVIVARRGTDKIRDATVVIRADAEVPTGKIQEVIQTAQESRFEKFALRAREPLGTATEVGP
jgi:biopolymer transport protein ExbD